MRRSWGASYICILSSGRAWPRGLQQLRLPSTAPELLLSSLEKRRIIFGIRYLSVEAMTDATAPSYSFDLTSSSFVIAIVAVCASAVFGFLFRRPSAACLPTQSHVNSPPPVRSAAAAAMKAMSTKDIIRKIITPPISPSSPAAASPVASATLSSRYTRQTIALSPPPASAPRASSPKSSRKSGKVFKADFIVAEKKDRGGVQYLIRLLLVSLLGGHARYYLNVSAFFFTPDMF